MAHDNNAGETCTFQCIVPEAQIRGLRYSVRRDYRDLGRTENLSFFAASLNRLSQHTK
jgi:hypothetical protein